MTVFIDQALQAVLLGGLYAVYALGLAVSAGVLRFINVAHGDLIVLMSYLFMTLAMTLGVPMPLAICLLIPAGALIGWGLQAGLFQRVESHNDFQIILVTFGLSVVVQNGLHVAFGADTRKVPMGGIKMASIRVADTLSVGILPLIVLGVSIVLICGLEGFLYFTRAGVMIRAIADDRDAGRLVGLPERKLNAIAMAVVGVTVAVAGMLMATWTNFDPTAGSGRLLIAFEVVVLGGLGSFWGVLAGGIIIAAAQSLGAYFDASLQLLAGHIAFLLIFILLPQGLFPKL